MKKLGLWSLLMTLALLVLAIFMGGKLPLWIVLILSITSVGLETKILLNKIDDLVANAYTFARLEDKRRKWTIGTFVQLSISITLDFVIALIALIGIIGSLTGVYPVNGGVFILGIVVFSSFDLVSEIGWALALRRISAAEAKVAKEAKDEAQQTSS